MNEKSDGCAAFDREVREAKKIAGELKLHRDPIVPNQLIEPRRHPLGQLDFDQQLVQVEKERRRHDAEMRRLRRLVG